MTTVGLFILANLSVWPCFPSGLETATHPLRPLQDSDFADWKMIGFLI